MPSPILASWKLTDKLPVYKAFSGVFTEDIDVPIMELLLNYSDICEEQKSLLTVIINNCKKSNVVNKVEHSQPYGIGRFYPKDEKAHPSIIQLKRELKHTIQQYSGWTDIDMCKSHLSIAYEVGKKNGHDFKTIGEYIKNNSEVIKSVMDYYNINEEQVKDIFRSGLNGGNFFYWFKQFEKDSIAIKTTTEMPMLVNFFNECKQIIELIYVNNNHIASKVAKKDDKENDTKKRVSFYWCSAIECEALHIVYKHLIKEGYLNERQCALEYDGLCGKLVKEFEPEALCDELNEAVKSKLGYPIKFSIKPYSKVIESVIEQRRTYVAPCQDITNLKDATNYEQWKKCFEINHCKIINRSVFFKVVKDTDGSFKEFVTFSEKELKTAYQHCTYEEVNDKGKSRTVSYIELWLKDKDQRNYEEAQMIAPPLECPANVFNLWTPFRIHQIFDNISWSDEEADKVITDAEFLLDHIKTICNNDEAVYQYLIRWIGQSLIYPAYKTTAPCLISKEGSGKGTIIKILKALMGSSKVLETAEPDKYVWGQFNDLMVNAYFISLNEMEQSLQEKAEGRVKQLITDDDMQINGKGKTAFKCRSYHRFWYSSNNKVPLKTTSGDRRNMIVRCSDVLKGNMEHFTKINQIINDDRVIKALYLYLGNLENLDKFHTELPPVTNYQEIVQESNKDTIELWLEDFTRRNPDRETCELLAKDILTDFITYRDQHRFKYEANSVKLMRNLLLMELPANALLTHKQVSRLKTNVGNKTMFDFKVLRKHFKLENIIIDDGAETENEEE
jgi:hypothetical protein